MAKSSNLRLTTIRITPQRQLEMPTDKVLETARHFWKKKADDRDRCLFRLTEIASQLRV